MKTTCRFLLVAFGLVAVPISGAWTKEPAGFRGARWNGTIADFKAVLPAMDCRGKGLKSTACYVDDFQVGDAHVKLSLDFLFSTGRLWIIAMDMRKADYPFLKKLFFEKYGPPTSRRSDGVITSFVWRGKEVQVELDPGDQYQGPGASFTAIASDKKLSAENGAERAQKDAARKAARKNAKDAF